MLNSKPRMIINTTTYPGIKVYIQGASANVDEINDNLRKDYKFITEFTTSGKPVSVFVACSNSPSMSKLEVRALANQMYDMFLPLIQRNIVMATVDDEYWQNEFEKIKPTDPNYETKMGELSEKFRKSVRICVRHTIYQIEKRGLDKTIVPGSEVEKYYKECSLVVKENIDKNYEVIPHTAPELTELKEKTLKK